MTRPDTLAEVARRVSAGAAFGPTLCEFLDEFYLHPERRQAMVEAEPPPLAEVREHPTLGAVGEHLARRRGLAAPAWTDHPSRFLHEPYFTEAEPLRRARMPLSPAPPPDAVAADLPLIADRPKPRIPSC